MTALEYLKKERKLFAQRLRLPTPIALIVMILGAYALGVFLFQKTTPKSIPSPKIALEGVVVVLAGAVVSFVLSRWFLDRRYNLFIKAHPEMDKLTKWTEDITGLPIGKYPTNEEEKEDLAPLVLAGLISRGERANDAFAFREAIQKLITTDGSFNSIGAYFMPQIEKTANEFNQVYLAFWDIMVNTMEINPTGCDHPRLFRESLRTRR